MQKITEIIKIRSPIEYFNICVYGIIFPIRAHISTLSNNGYFYVKWFQNSFFCLFEIYSELLWWLSSYSAGGLLQQCTLSIVYFFFLPSFLQITLPAKKNPQLLLIQLSSFKLKGKKASPLYTLPINFQENISIL